MIKRFVLWLLREELSHIENKAESALIAHREWISSSLAVSFQSVRAKAEAVSVALIELSSKVDTLVMADAASAEALSNLNEEIELLAGAHEHLDDIVQCIVGGIDDDVSDLGHMLEDLYMGMDIIADRLDEMEG